MLIHACKVMPLLKVFFVNIFALFLLEQKHARKPGLGIYKLQLLIHFSEKLIDLVLFVLIGC